MARGDRGINKLDDACREHDIAYSEHKDTQGRYTADKKLTSEALKRVFALDSSIGERTAALAVSAAMKAKTSLTKFGSGLTKKLRKKCKKVRKVKSKTITLAALMKNAKAAIKKSKPKTINSAINAALFSVKKSQKGKKVAPTRVIKLPVRGGALPLIPILAGLSAIGSVISSDQHIENKRNGVGTEPVKVGKGLYLAPYKKSGMGLYLRPSSKN